jgi:Uma2 family endonuclease
MAHQIITGHRVSYEEYKANYAGKRYEYIDGYAVPMGLEITTSDGDIIVSPTKPEHGELALEVGRLFGNFVRAHNLGKVYGAETGFIMEPETRQIRAADVAFVAKERIHQIKPGEWIPFPPDLAVEIISEYEKASDIRRKVQEYMDNGTRLLLLFFPDTRVIDVYRPGQPTLTRRPGDALDGYDVLPGFTADVSAIFDVLDN